MLIPPAEGVRKPTPTNVPGEAAGRAARKGVGPRNLGSVRRVCAVSVALTVGGAKGGVSTRARCFGQP